MSTSPLTSQPASPGKKAAHLSKDGKWRLFPKVPHLLQYVSSGTYYARVVVDGKLFRTSLKTKVFTNAKLRLADFLKEKRLAPPEEEGVSVGTAIDLYETSLRHNAALKPRSRHYRTICLRKIRASWPGIETLRVCSLTEEACRAWAAEVRTGVAAQYFNNIVGTLRLVLREGIKRDVAQGLPQIKNPVEGVAPAKIPRTHLTLPESSMFQRLIETIRAKRCRGGVAADLVAFLAYSGTRLYTEAAHVIWEDVDWSRGELIVRGDPTTGTKNWEVRRIPLIPDLEQLLLRMKAEREVLGLPLSGKILSIVECPITLRKTCHELGIPRLRHHDLRHLFATRCIESGVDIPTVARWLGHKDGGALAMRVYGHLRNEHSKQMAQKVKF